MRILLFIGCLCSGLGFSATVTAGQTRGLLPLTQVWKYQQDGLDPGTAWRAPEYEDSGWAAGEGAFGYDDNPAVASLIRTPLKAETNGMRIATYYFRTHFEVTALSEDYLLSFSNLVDDGAIFYLNGTEILRVNMPNGPVNYETRALVPVSVSREGILVLANAPASELVVGDNVLAVEVHQSDLDSTDIVFATAVVHAPLTPLFFINQPTNATPIEGTSTLLSARVGGSLPHYQWFKNGQAIVDATNETRLIIPLTRADAGHYHLVASNKLGGITSDVATVTVLLLGEQNFHAPELLSALPASAEGGGIIVTFSQDLESASAENPANYAITRADTGSAIPIQSAGPDGTHGIRLQLPTLTPGTNYILTVNGVRNAQGIPVRTDSRVLIVTVLQLFSFGAVWRYDDTGNDPGTAWKEPGFNDSSWAAGPGLLYNDENFSPPVGTVGATLVNATNALGGIVTHYFRQHLTMPARPVNARLHLRYVVDDGMVVYLNGVELGRLGMSAGPVTATTRASSTAIEGALNLWSIDTDSVVAGDNIFAVEVHQFSLTSPNTPDITFGIEASLEADSYENIPPQVLRDPETTIVNERASVTFSADILAATHLQWLRNGVPIPGAKANSLTIPIATALDNGIGFSLFASNTFGTAISGVARLGIVFDTDSPALLGANMGTNDQQVTITFSEPLDVTTATHILRYSIRNELGEPLPLLDASLDHGSNVVLRTQPRNSGFHFTLTIDGVRDASELGNAVSGQIPVGYEIVRLPWDWVWLYDDTGLDPGTIWRETAFDDSIWPRGPGLLGFEDIDTPPSEPIRTLLPPPEFRGPTYYFRTWSAFVPHPEASAIWLRYYVDDGAVFFLNGVEIHRVAVPSNQNYQTLATRPFEAVTEGPYELTRNAFLPGTNLFAVEVHQVTPTSADSVFGMQLTEAFDVQPLRPVPPRLKFSRVGPTVILTWENQGYLLESAPTPIGPWQRAPAPTIPYSVVTSESARFYRLRKV